MNYDKMTDEQLVELQHAGDVQVTDFIVDKYKYLVRKKAKAMFILGGENDDLIQEGMIGLFKAVRDFDSQLQVSFYSFAELCISRQMYTAIEASKRKKHIPLNSYISIYGEDEESEEKKSQPLIDTIQGERLSNPEALFIDKEYLEDMESKLSESLSDLENKVLYLHLMGTDYHTVGRLLGKSSKTIDNALQRIKTKAQAILRQH